MGSIALDGVVLVGGSPGRTAESSAAMRGALADPIMLEMLSDAEVMLRVAAGDDGAFDYLVEKYRRSMISFMYRMTHNQAVAEELAQEVFPARVSLSADLRRQRQVHDLVVSHCD